MPLDKADELTGGGHVANWLPGIGNYDDDLDRYGFVARNLDVIYQASEMFWTNRIFFEWYIDLFDEDVWVNTNPQTNTLVLRIQEEEGRGKKVEHIIIAREGWLYEQYDGLDGPIAEDPRILYTRDVQELRTVFSQAHQLGLLKYPDYKLIQMVVDPDAFVDIPAARDIIALMDGVAYEAHQFGDNWPLGVHKSDPVKLARGANWTLDQGLEYVFYYGPIRSSSCLQYGEEHYPEPDVERTWMQAFWAAGLPIQHDKMTYYLNLFPFWCGADRPVGPESDPNSMLGYTKWLIEQVKPESEWVGPEDFIFSPLVFDYQYYYDTYPDLQSALGLNETALRNHWKNVGISEGRQAHPDFNSRDYLNDNPELLSFYGEDYFEAIRHFIIKPSKYLDFKIFNYECYRNLYPDLQNAFGNDTLAYQSHWKQVGIDEGRQAHPNFSVRDYLTRYADLQRAFDTDYRNAINHYLGAGLTEGRNGAPLSPVSCMDAPVVLQTPKPIPTQLSSKIVFKDGALWVVRQNNQGVEFRRVTGQKSSAF
jgi:hypothetical protein